MIDDAPIAIKRQLALVRPDFVMVFPPSATKRMDHVKHISKLSRDAGVPLTLGRCNFINGTVKLLDRVIRPSRLKIASHPVSGNKRFKALLYVIELKSFSGFCNVFRYIVLKI